MNDLGTELKQYLLENAMRSGERGQVVRNCPIAWLRKFQNILQDPEVFGPILIMLDDSLAIEEPEERCNHIHRHLKSGFSTMCKTGNWVYQSPASQRPTESQLEQEGWRTGA